jgi:hypothetical protein
VPAWLPGSGGVLAWPGLAWVSAMVGTRAASRSAFRGRWLAEHFESGDPAVATAPQYFAAQGVRGGLALWQRGRDDDYADARSFSTYSNLSEAAGERWPQDFLSAVASALDEEYAEEIDL